MREATSFLRRFAFPRILALGIVGLVLALLLRSSLGFALGAGAAGALALLLVGLEPAKLALAGFLSLALALAGGEAVFRLSYFGVPGLSLREFKPRLFPGGHRDDRTYTGHAQGQAMHMGRGVRFNSEGFRGPGVNRERIPGVFRIAYVGASVGWGAGVGEEERFTDRAGSALAMRGACKSELINLSIVAARAGELIDAERWSVETYRPDLIVLEAGRTLFRNLSAVDVSRFRFEAHEADASSLLAGKRELLYHSFFLNLLYAKSTELFPDWEFESGRIERELVHAYVTRAKAAAGSTPLAFFVLPELGRSGEWKAFGELVVEEAKAAGVPVLDSRGIEFPGSLSEWRVYPGDTHPNSAAHERIAGLLVRELGAAVASRGCAKGRREASPPRAGFSPEARR